MLTTVDYQRMIIGTSFIFGSFLENLNLKWYFNIPIAVVGLIGLYFLHSLGEVKK